MPDFACRRIRQEKQWRRESESNRRPRLCRPLHNHSAIPPCSAKRISVRRDHKSLPAPFKNPVAGETGKGKRSGTAESGHDSSPFSLVESGAGNESRTRDLNLGKVALYQLSYSRMRKRNYRAGTCFVKETQSVEVAIPMAVHRASIPLLREPLAPPCADSRSSTKASVLLRCRSARFPRDVCPEGLQSRCKAAAGSQSSGLSSSACQ